MYKGSFGREIEAHLELQRRNSRLEIAMPIARYRDTVAAELNDVALASRAVSAEMPEVNPPAEAAVHGVAWGDLDSWWDVREPLAEWER